MTPNDAVPGADAIDATNATAVRVQEWFETYLLTLTFTLLAAAVPTAPHGTALTPHVVEWTGWGLLFLAGLCGLWRMERRSHAYELHVVRLERQSLGRTLAQQKREGVEVVVFNDATLPIAEAITKQRGEVARVTEKIDRRTALQLRVYAVQKGLFVAGLAAVMIARALASVGSPTSP